MNKRIETEVTPLIGTAGFVIEGLYNWIFAMGGTPHICIVADWPGNQLPSTLPVQPQRVELGEDGEAIDLPVIVLNIGQLATRGLTFYRGEDSDNPADPVTHLLFSGRSKGEHFDGTVDVDSIMAVFMMEESGRGMSLGNNPALNDFINSKGKPNPPTKPAGKPTLMVVK